MLDFDKKVRTADYSSRHEVIRMIQGVTRWDGKRNEDLYKQSKNAAHCSSNQQEQTSMAWSWAEKENQR